MAAMMTTFSSASANLPALPESEYKVTGIANVLVFMEAGKIWYFGLEGDRRNLTAAQKAAWASHFHVMDELVQGPPHSPYYTKEPDSEGTCLVMCGEKFDKLKVAEAQFQHAMSKGWIPLIFGSLEDARKAVTNKEYALQKETLLRFHDLMLEFTRVTEGQRYHEVVMGGREGEEHILETVARETDEEAGVAIDASNPAIRFIGYSDMFMSRKTGEECVTGIFVTFVDREATEADFKAAMDARRPTGYEYDCPHAFYKKLPVDPAAAKLEKGNLEVVSGAFHELDLDGALHPNMDFKNKKIMQKVIPYLKALTTAPRLERQCAVAPAAAAAPAASKYWRKIFFAAYKDKFYRWTSHSSGFNELVVAPFGVPRDDRSVVESEWEPVGDDYVEVIDNANWAATFPAGRSTSGYSNNAWLLQADNTGAGAQEPLDMSEKLISAWILDRIYDEDEKWFGKNGYYWCEGWGRWRLHDHEEDNRLYDRWQRGVEGPAQKKQRQ